MLINYKDENFLNDGTKMYLTHFRGVRHDKQKIKLINNLSDLSSGKTIRLPLHSTSK